MPRALRLCLAASVALVACGRTPPLSTRGTSPAEAGEGGSDDGGPVTSSTDAGASSVDVSSAAPIPDAAVADASIDAREDLIASDGGRVPYRAIGVATGEVHTCALLDDHRVKCWGNNSFGQLGYGDTRDRGGSPADMGDNLPIVDLGTGRTATAIAASRYASCAILDDGSVRCWGMPGLNDQGLAPDNLQNTGDEPGEMGDHLPALDFGGRRAVHLAMGEVAACASMDDDTIWCWDVGATPWPQFWLPAKPVSALASDGGGLVALYDDGTISPQLPNGRDPILTSDRKAIAVAGAVGTGTCVLFDDGTSTCTDGDAFSFVGPANAIAIGVERDHGLCSAFSDGSVECQSQSCGQPTYYQCSSNGSFALGAAAVTVTSNGSQFACALLADGGVKCWGDYPDGPPNVVWLGSEVDFTVQSDGGIAYGTWHSVDLGTHP